MAYEFILRKDGTKQLHINMSISRKSGVGLLLVLFGYGVLGALLGGIGSSLLAGLSGVAVLYFAFLRNLKKTIQKKSALSTRLKHSQETLKKMLRYGVPLPISSVLAGVLSQFNFFLIASSSQVTLPIAIMLWRVFSLSS